jgi:arylsulfatase
MALGLWYRAGNRVKGGGVDRGERFRTGPAVTEESLLSGTQSGVNVVVCVIDAARADHIGCYGYARETTPSIDRLAGESVVFQRHYAPYPHTKASTASLFSAQHADTHQAVGAVRMSPDTFTMDRGLRDAGYTAALFTSNPWASTALGLSAEFDVTRVARRGSPGREVNLGRLPDVGGEEQIGAAPEELVASFTAWLSGRAQTAFFAYLHFMPPHHPYVAPKEMEALFLGQKPPGYERGHFPFQEVADLGGPASHRDPGPALVNRYDANLRYADQLVQQIVNALADSGLLEETLLIITSDHGEALGEHGYNWHPACPFDEALYIPLLIRFPTGTPNGRVRALSQTLDIMPTIYDLLGLPMPDSVTWGKSLLSLITGEKERVHGVILARTDGDTPCYVVRDDRYTLLLYSGGKFRALYDMAADPRQLRNIIHEQPDVAARMEAAFHEFAATQPTSLTHFIDSTAPLPAESERPKVEISREMRQELEALGYLR